MVVLGQWAHKVLIPLYGRSLIYQRSLLYSEQTRDQWAFYIYIIVIIKYIYGITAHLRSFLSLKISTRTTMETSESFLTLKVKIGIPKLGLMLLKKVF